MPAPKRRTREEKAAAGAVLLVRDRAADDLSDEARAAAQAARERVRGREEDAAALAAALLYVGRKFARDAGNALARARAQARAAARKRLRAELAVAGVTLALPATSESRDAHDTVLAAIVGESLAAQWRAVAFAADRAGVPSEKVFRPRLERAATTEAARAYSDEHAAVLRELAAREPGVAVRLMREWSAMVDACERCWPHDGERAGLTESYAGGDEPGSVHPHCACVETVVEA